MGRSQPVRPGWEAAGSEELLDRFRRELGRPGGPTDEDALLVAVSGGNDSLVLLHLLRFGRGLPRFRLAAAHFDHGMREGSRQDADWVQGVCRAWGIPLHRERAGTIPSGEDAARVMRYAFLRRVKEDTGAAFLLTAHHADDQAETVLFRVLRGTGLRGLGGIPRSRSPGVFRPLLPFGRAELEGYARAMGLRPREDPTNRELTLPRNYLRHRGIPEMEENVAPGARTALLRLARLARENEEAWDQVVPVLTEGLVEVDERGVFIVRSALLAYHPALRARLLRAVLHRHGVRLREAGTRSLLEFTRTGASGRSIALPGGFRLHREFDRFLLAPDGGCGEDHPLILPALEGGSGTALVGRRRLEVVWGHELPEPLEWTAAFGARELEFPLRVRGWLPGDRITLPYGTKKLKKLLAEAGLGAGERGQVPVVEDASGHVLWVAGIAVSVRARPSEAEARFLIGIGRIHGS